MKETKIKSIRYKGKKDVYNIQMKQNHNFFANNILVSNCDALRYLINTVVKKQSRWY